jgi:hypothetical protein
MTPPLQLVSAQFPHLQQRVACLFESDVLFRELCEDYEACTEALARQTSDEGLRCEYAALRLRLETELLEHLRRAEEPHVRR